MLRLRAHPVRCAIAMALAAIAWFSPAVAAADCSAPANVVVAENCLPGTPPSVWDTSGDRSIEGFTTDFSVNVGETVEFKVKSTAASWFLEIYRMGYYGGDGARQVATVQPSVPLPQQQPNCLTRPSTGLVDCGNWAVSATWRVPDDAVSGIYFARAVRSDTGRSSHIFFVVRDDARHADILFQTADTTWQAYNEYGGNSLYAGSPAGRAYEVSYNRPFRTREIEPETWVFNAEYPMVRWLESNGYDVAYHAGIDADRHGGLIQNHRVWLSNGHDEYWSAAQWAHVEAARDAGVHLAFFSGNKVFWRIRWENAIDGSGRPYRTMVCYKDTLAGSLRDPSGDATGTWRDGRFNADGGRPENELTGSIFMINGPYQGTITVPYEDGKMRFWRNTGVAALQPGGVATLARGTLGTEIDVDLHNGFRPPGLIGLSTNHITTNHLYLLDHGGTYGAGTATHRLTLYRHESGALVFSTGTYQWSWGLDANHDRREHGSATHRDMKQATVNLLADMGVQPATLDPTLLQASASSDTTPPLSSVTWPLPGSMHPAGSEIVFTGTATDVGGTVGAVEVSVDGGATWHAARGRGSWSWEWQPDTHGMVTLLTRAVDDSGNLEPPGPGVSFSIESPPPCDTCTLFGEAIPTVRDGGGDRPVELGMTFYSEVEGRVRGIRFYKSPANVGTHVGRLWTIDGTLLGTATFANETASGWQQANFAQPIEIAANTPYVASYHTTVGHYAADVDWAGTFAPPLRAPAHGSIVGGRVVSNGLYTYGPSGSFPQQTWMTANYWVDVAFDPRPLVLSSLVVAPAEVQLGLDEAVSLVAHGTYEDGSTRNLTDRVTWSADATSVATVNAQGRVHAVGEGTTEVTASYRGLVAGAAITVAVGPLQVATAALPDAVWNEVYAAQLEAAGGVPPYTWSITGGLPDGIVLVPASGALVGVTDRFGDHPLAIRVIDANGSEAQATLVLSVVEPVDHSLWTTDQRPVVSNGGRDSPVEVGMTFYAEVAGSIRGIRFYKDAANTGPHVGHLWSIDGALLASATFTNETASGWQEALFAVPVSIQPNTLYVASYHTTVGHYASDLHWTGTSRGPLRAPAGGTTVNGRTVRNGVYAYGPAGSFPNSVWNNTNYGVDVVFRSGGATLRSISVSPAQGSVELGGSLQLTANGHYSDNVVRDLTGDVAWSVIPTSGARVDAGGRLEGLYPGTVEVTAALNGVVGTASIDVTVGPLSIVTTEVGPATQGAAWTTTFAATGGLPPYTWSRTGALPQGYALDPASGVLGGTTAAAGTYSFTVQVSDAVGSTASRTFELTVLEPLDVSLHPANWTPARVDGGGDRPVELGVTFYSEVPGWVRGIRFYKSAANVGTHVGSLWSTNGARLANAVFQNETASGWQEVLFATPVLIEANRLYVASYHTTVGHYAVETNWPGRHVAPLHAPADGTYVNGTRVQNGRFAYGPAGTFPNSTWFAGYYGVDLVFRPSEPLPRVASIEVTPGTGTIHPGARWQFLATGLFTDGSSRPVDAVWSSSAPDVVDMGPTGIATGLSGGAALVSATVGGVTGSAALTVTDLTPDPADGPGGPILVIASPSNPFSFYLAEILRAEGLNAFRVADLSQVTRSMLDQHDVAVLGEVPLSGQQVTMLEEWVTAGGRLLAMRPDPKLASLLGITPTGTTLSRGYLRIHTADGPGAGLAGQTLQFHGAADRYGVSGAASIATLYSTATAATTAPAVTLRNVGAGQAAAFTFDLARSVVYMRQGNPAWSGQRRDGYSQIRSDNLFFGNASFDPQPDWIDLDRVAIPQADEKQRLLANLILRMNLERRPLPRFWYLPSFHKAVVVMTGDDHANGGTRRRFDDYAAYSPANCSLDDWECVRSTSYIYTHTPLSVPEARQYEAQGFEVALHVSTGCADWTSFGHLSSTYSIETEAFASRYVGLAPPSTNRTHCVIWSDYDSQPVVSWDHGIRLDTNYYYWPGSWVRNRPGFMTGSGMPMRFTTRQGHLIDVYQAATQMTDESGQSYPFTVNALLDGAIGPNGYYGVFTANMHTDFNPLWDSDAIVSSAQARGVPIISARQLLTWLDGRNGSTFTDIAWTSDVLSFGIDTAAGARNLRAMVPRRVGQKQVASVRRNGALLPHTTETIKGIDYVVFEGATATYSIFYQ